MRFDLQSLVPKLREFRPTESVASGSDVIGVDEQRSRKAQLLQNRIGVLEKGFIAIVEGQDNALSRKLTLQRSVFKEFFETHDPDPLRFQIAHLLVEAFHAD